MNCFSRDGGTRISLGGTLAPRRNVSFGGWAVRWAQSSGLWPGERRTLREGVLEMAVLPGERDEQNGEDFGGAREEDGGARRVEAVDGGGRRALDVVRGLGIGEAVGLD